MGQTGQLNILIVDDNELTRALLNVILCSANYQIVGELDSAEQAIALVPQLRPNLILLDNVMPGMMGIDAIAPLKALLPDVVIIMVTGNDDAASVGAAISAGAHGFIVKPLNAASVLSTVRKIGAKFDLHG